MLNKIKSFIKRPKKYHWYQVRCIYKINENKMFDFTFDAGLSEQKTILNKREIKKLCKPLHEFNKVKELINNGTLDLEVVCYLGKFSK